ncbi:DUF1573 domain-containing protein [Candidatus Daviesbacteria bacterium]|nr:DUF1573 domain-containing protein [Candidatus Daviesbacteria bacterium]
MKSSSSSSPSKNIAKTQNAKAEASETSFDWGQIDYNGPKATKTFKIKNVGTDTLKLNNIKTSCTCTSAQVIINQKGSPFFSMHSNSSWIGEVQPGKEAELAIRFDQSFHGPSGVGPIERIISVETNDANNPKLEFILKGYVVKS